MELIGLFIALLAIVIITSKWHQVIYALLFGNILIAFFSSMSMNTIISIIMEVTINIDTISLVIIVLLITLFSSIMYKTLLLDKLLESLINLIKNIHVLISVIPALVGLLAVPGGAVMSVPFIDKLGDKVKMSSGYKSGVNIFFRHIAVFFNPLSPLLIVVADLSTLGFLPIMKFHLVPVAVSLIVSYLIMIHFWPLNAEDIENITLQSDNMPYNKAFKQFIFSGLPLVVAIVLALVFEVSFVITLVIAILLSIFFDYKSEKILKLANISEFFIKGINWKLGLSVYTIFLFGEFVKDSGAIPQLAELITRSNMPLLLIVIVTSVLIGFAAGHPIVGGAIVYPIFLPLVGPENVTYLSLILSGMLFGYVVSPIHLCLIVSNEYFKADYLESYRILIPLQLILLISAIIMAVLW
ncbi:MAG: hypothetical protein APF76_06530 [Desulfitibacter sp. BRH_c19]|nr:MAG: hypothetical protein APF76_06530 [Desulfitibacter sp. BRH_c19]